MVRPLEARAFVAARFHEPLLVGLLIIQRACREKFARCERNLSELNGLIALITPLIHVVPGITNLNHLEIIAACILDFFLLLIAIPTPAALTIFGILGFRCA